MNYQFVSDLSEEHYQMFAYEHPLYNLYQSVQWSRIKREWESFYVGLYNEDELIIACLVLCRKLPLNRTLFYLPKGPLADFNDKEALSAFFDGLRSLAKSKHAISIKITPNIRLSSVLFKEIAKHQPVRESKIIENIEACGFTHYGFNLDMYETAQPRFCAAFYYYDQWLQSDSKALKTASKALKKGVELEYLDHSQLALFAKIMDYTSKRKNISLRNEEYYQRIVDNFNEDALIVVSKIDLKKQLDDDQKRLAELEDQINNKLSSERKIKGLIEQVESLKKEISFKQESISIEQDVVYISCLLAVKVKDTVEMLYAGMNERYRKYYGSYLTYLEGIKWGYERGCIRCDFGGIPGTLDDGLTEFKGYFQPHVEEYIGEFNMIIDPMMNSLFDHALAFFKVIRRIIRGFKK